MVAAINFMGRLVIRLLFVKGELRVSVSSKSIAASVQHKQGPV